MTIEKKLLGTNPVDGAVTVEDVFSTYLYTGNGDAHTINNGIDLSGKGGLVWFKDRAFANGIDHILVDSERGKDSYLSSNTTAAAATSTDVCEFNSTGFDLTNFTYNNGNTRSFVSWTFRNAPKFFKAVTFTYSGSSSSPTVVTHDLGCTVGMAISKRTSGSAGWFVQHRSITGSNNNGNLNENGNMNNGNGYSTSFSSITDTTATFGATASFPAGTYVAYFFADNSAEDADEQMIKCGSYTATGDNDINLGWEPQFILSKRANSNGDWEIHDTMRGLDWYGYRYLSPNTNDDESLSTGAYLFPTATGFTNKWFSSNDEIIYMAIRAPMMVEPSAATEVYAANTYAGDNANGRSFTGLGLTPDVNIITGLGGMPSCIGARLIGPGMFETDSTSVSYATLAGWMQYDMDGFTFPTKYTYSNSTGNNYVAHNFKRAKGFFDVVAYTGTGSQMTLNHSLGAVPQMIWVKNRSTLENWEVYTATTGINKRFKLNTSQGTANSTGRWGATPTTTQFSVNEPYGLNRSGHNFIAYLWSTLDGVSKVGTYTGNGGSEDTNGTSQTIDCGFAAGARFILIKQYDVGDGGWFVWDTTRGIVAGNDPYLTLNTTAAEVTSNDSIDPSNSGFIVNQVAATDINVTSSTYIYLAIA
jgi:hypothetical protein